MICGVNTETGVHPATTVVVHKERKSFVDIFKGTLNKEIKALCQLRTTLVENVFRLSDIKSQNVTNLISLEIEYDNTTNIKEKPKKANR